MTAEVSRQTYPFSLPDLPYAYDALEPHLDEKTLRVHHREHHGTYVKKLNEALAGEPSLQKLTLAELLRDTAQLPEAVRTAVKNNGGGHLNHDLFWNSMSPARARAPRGPLADALASAFGSFDAFRAKFGEIAGKHFASGWIALTQAHSTNEIAIVELKDHEVVRDARVLLMLDVWEHAYYVKFQNRRPEFVTAFWEVVNWARTEERFTRSVAAATV